VNPAKKKFAPAAVASWQRQSPGKQDQVKKAEHEKEKASDFSFVF
jgi:hypothetical protein